MAVTFKRGGATARDWYEEGGAALGSSPKEASVYVVFSMSSKGGGTTDVEVWV